jgi:hypothetical protein
MPTKDSNHTYDNESPGVRHPPCLSLFLPLASLTTSSPTYAYPILIPCTVSQHSLLTYFNAGHSNRPQLWTTLIICRRHLLLHPRT